MIEIRPILREEAEAFLELLCKVFDLDSSRARGVFFSEPLFDLNRKWGLFRSGRLASILTTVPMQFGWGNAVGIAGVATEREDRGNGLAAKLLTEVLTCSKAAGETAAFLFAKDTRLYEKCDFRVLDRVIHAPLMSSESPADARLLGFDEVRSQYERWSAKDSNRLLRSDKRWQYWKWNLRMCQKIGEGYVCLEGNVVREAVDVPIVDAWPIGTAREWFGLRSMAEKLQVPTQSPREDLWLMGCGVDRPPEMFMTDQF